MKNLWAQQGNYPKLRHFSTCYTIRRVESTILVLFSKVFYPYLPKSVFLFKIFFIFQKIDYDCPPLSYSHFVAKYGNVFEKYGKNLKRGQNSHIQPKCWRCSTEMATVEACFMQHPANSEKKELESPDSKTNFFYIPSILGQKHPF